jgi:acyl-ACP thioesterase
MVVRRFPSLREPVTLQTFCGAIGPRWAERRTVGTGESGAHVEADVLWVHLDPTTGQPSRLDDRYAEVYGEAAGDRRARSRLRHPPPPADAPRFDFRFRAADRDLADHVNNAAYWTVVEERLGEPDALDAEIEYRDAAQPGPVLVAHDDAALWITSPDGVVHASVVVRC